MYLIEFKMCVIVGNGSCVVVSHQIFFPPSINFNFIHPTCRKFLAQATIVAEISQSTNISDWIPDEVLTIYELDDNV